MGFTIILENEKSEAIHRLTKEFDYRVLRTVDLSQFAVLKYLDFYGDTVFNALQLDDLVTDFEKLKAMLGDVDGRIQQIVELAETSRQQVHTYIKFYGD